MSGDISILAALDLDLEIEEGHLVEGALVLMKIIDEDGDAVIRVVHSDGLSDMEIVGMLRIAERDALDSFLDRSDS